MAAHTKLCLAAAIGLCLSASTVAQAQPALEALEEPAAAPDPAPIAPVPRLSTTPHAYNEARILGVIPDYQTVTEGNGRITPLTRRQKWGLALKETVDPFNLVNAALSAGFSQMGDQTPKYGEGGAAYGQRVGAALADFGAQNLFSAGLLASVLHQDPRYFRRGPQSGVLARVLHSVSRVVIARQDSGRSTFNFSGILGMGMGIAASNLYYPSASIRGEVMAGRVETSLFGSLTGNLMSEFWPDIQKKFFHKKSRS